MYACISFLFLYMTLMFLNRALKISVLSRYWSYNLDSKKYVLGPTIELRILYARFLLCCDFFLFKEYHGRSIYLKNVEAMVC